MLLRSSRTPTAVADVSRRLKVTKYVPVFGTVNTVFVPSAVTPDKSCSSGKGINVPPISTSSVDSTVFAANADVTVVPNPVAPTGPVGPTSPVAPVGP